MRRADDVRKLLTEQLSDYVLLVPLLATVVAYLVGLGISPDIDTEAQHARWTSFFGTAAQVIATLLVVLALEGRLAMLPRLAGAIVTVIYIGVGLLAAGTGLSPSLSDDLYCHVFAVTVAAGIGALSSVVLIGIRALMLEYGERDEAFRAQVDQLYAALKRKPGN